MTQDEADSLRAAIEATQYKYFGDYELSSDQWDAIDTLISFAQRHLKPFISETDHLGGES